MIVKVLKLNAFCLIHFCLVVIRPFAETFDLTQVFLTFLCP